jgi:hypothetical protein
MEVGVAVLEAAPALRMIRAAQLGEGRFTRKARARRHCLRVGCIPTKAWVQTAFALKAEESFAKSASRWGGGSIAASNAWKAGVSKQMTRASRASSRRTASSGSRAPAFKDANTLTSRREDVRSSRRSSRPARIGARRSRARLARCVDSTGCSRRSRCHDGSSSSAEASAAVRLDLQPLRLRGDDHRMSRSSRRRTRTRARSSRSSSASAASRCTSASSARASRTTAPNSPSTSAKARPCRRPDASPSVGPLVHGSASSRRQVRPPLRHRWRRAPAHHRPTSTRSATAPATGSSRTPRSAKARSPRRTPRATRRCSTTAPSRVRSTTDPEIAVGLAGSRHEEYGRRRGRPVPVGRKRARRDAGRDGRLGQVGRDALRRAARPVMVGPHVTDMVEPESSRRRRVDSGDGRRHRRIRRLRAIKEAGSPRSAAPSGGAANAGRGACKDPAGERRRMTIVNRRNTVIS